MNRRLAAVAVLAASATVSAAHQNAPHTIREPIVTDVSDNELLVTVDYVYGGSADEDVFLTVDVLDRKGESLPGITDDVTEAEIERGEGSATNSLTMDKAVGTFTSTALRVCLSSRDAGELLCETFPYEKTWTTRLLSGDEPAPEPGAEDGAGGSPAGKGEADPAPAPPRIDAFSATPRSVVQGEPVTLAWKTTGTSTVRLRPGGGTPDDWRAAGLGANRALDASGHRQVRPRKTMTYTLIARQAGMPDVERSVRVNVRGPAASSAPKLVHAHACTPAKAKKRDCRGRFKYKGREELKVCRYLRLANVSGKHTLELKLHKFDYVLGDFHPDVLGTEKATFQHPSQRSPYYASFCDKQGAAIGLLGYEVFVDGRSLGWLTYEVLP